MSEQGIIMEEIPRLKNPLLIAGFEGWGNALNISKGMAEYLIRKLDSKPIATINPDIFYQYNQLRPVVNIEEGRLKTLSPPGGSFHAIKTEKKERDIVVLRADEPNLKWNYFMAELFSFCRKLAIDTVITLGSFYDNIMHTDRIVSGYASDNDLVASLQQKKVNLISYNGPSAIHTTIQAASRKEGFQCIGLWCHCPYYLQGTTHFGILAHLGTILSSLGNFFLDVTELEKDWENLSEKIQKLVDNNQEFSDLVTQLRKEKVRGTLAGMKDSSQDNQKIINIEDFLKPR